MKHVLVIKSSLQGEHGNSSIAAERYIQANYADSDVTIARLDLSAIDLPHLTAQEMQAWSTPESERNKEQKALAARSESFIDDLNKADDIVFAVPMYNFAIPSTLKAYFDRIARAGITFKYTENGPEGLIKHKNVTVLAARGGMYQGTPLDTQSEYVKNFLAFLGMSEVKFHYIEGLAMGEEAASNAWQKFSSQISEPNTALEH
uniref:FMN-dependent NADH-azoreductase n=1 Tax=Ningiella ruwaisensis TaxID=2364274 RepID=UPI0010A0645B|nr:NAD(P)H-dependent oxidoreductase [Ningiella ruwaisensis]